MGGAFVAVADDASAVYWNPAGLALGGAFFSLVLDGGQSEAEPDDQSRAGRQSSALIALSTLPLGVSYYRLSASRLGPAAESTFISSVSPSVERLTTHHVGVTLVQSVTSRLAVAATVKAIRGLAASEDFLAGNPDDLLDDSNDLPRRSTTKFDTDIGVMANLGGWRAGLTLRNVTEPDFETPSGRSLELERQSRAGVSYVGLPGVIAAADIDLERARGLLGDVRNLAAGAEAKLVRRVTVRGGVRFNTLSDEPGGHAPVAAFGGSVATFRSLLIDGQVTVGSKSGGRGWGIAARLVY